MIRKPTEKDFQEGVAISALRETKRVATASGEGVTRGFQGIARVYLYGMFWFGVLATVVPAMVSGHFFAGLIFLGFAYGLQQLLRKGMKGYSGFLNRGKPPPPQPIDPREILAEVQQVREQARGDRPSHALRQFGDFKLRPSVAVRQAFSLLLPALLLIVIGFGVVLPLIPGLVMLVTAVLILFKAAFDRDILSFDHRSVTVNGLLSKRTVAWSEVLNVAACVHPWYHLKVLLFAGSRRTIVLTVREPLGELRDLLIPMDLLDLDKDGLIALVADLFGCQAASGHKVAAWQPPVEVEVKPTPATDPRASFDPEAIMARYLSERSEVVAAVRPDLVTETAYSALQARKTFGRKAA